MSRMTTYVGPCLTLFLFVKIALCIDCNQVPEYNTLLELRFNDNCMNVDLVFKYLEQINTKSSAYCRIDAINLLAAHFGPNPSIPTQCSCQGVTQLQQYHFGPGDGVYEIRDYCLRAFRPYSDTYFHFFESRSTTNYTKACETHHKVWSALSTISSMPYQDSSCQKDMIFHLNYAFEQHPDKCVCTDTPAHINGNQGHNMDPCSQHSSYNRLLQLGNTDDCLSANSVWHYLDDLQIKDPECRRKIQQHLASKYHNAHLQSHDNCACHPRGQLNNHEIHNMNNGSLIQCRDQISGGYRVIEHRLFSNIEAHGCVNHNYLWPNLDSVMQFCYSNGYCIDCQQDLIVRAAIQYPDDGSDSCVCSRVKTTAKQDTPTNTPTTTPNATPTTLSTKMASTTSKGAIQTSTFTTQRPTPLLKFTCDKLTVVENIAKSVIASDPRSSYCNPSSGGSDEAFILSTCNMTSPMTWTRGINVMVDCQSGNPLVPTYTPVSTFESKNYVALGAQTAVFLGCHNSGIKIAVQKCNSTPQILNIENGAFINNPHNYYVIV